MTSTDLIIAIIVVAAIAITFLAVKRSSTSRGQLSTVSTPLTSNVQSLIDRLAGRHTNLEAGSLVPESGYYECMICGPGGLLDATAVGIFGEAEARRRAAARPSAMKYFRQGESFPNCPNCGPAAGWSLLKQ